jgi:hypothetical protein
MKAQDIVDFETEIRKVCAKYEKKIAHAVLVGILTVVRHLYLDAQFEKFKEEERTIPPKGESPSPVKND